MVHSMGDAFSDIYTFTAYENEMGELFLAEWLFDMGYLFFFRVCSVCSGYAQSYLEKTNEVWVNVKEGIKSKLS